MNDVKYLWSKQNGQYKQLYHINLEYKPYYIGNNKHVFTNIKPSDNNLDVWIGKDTQNEIINEIIIEMIILPSISNNNHDSSSFFIKEEQLFRKITKSDWKIVNYKKFLENNEFQTIIKLCNIYFNNKKINNDLCIICDEDTIQKINYQIKKNKLCYCCC